MNAKTTTLCLLLTVIGLSACSQTSSDVKATEAKSTEISQSCQSGEVQLSADFPTGRMDQCERIGEAEFNILLQPENTPINSSPWYAFSVTAKKPTEVKVNMRVEGAEHRYLPKQSRDLSKWQKIEYRDRGEVRSFKVTAVQQPTYIAGQEILSNQYYVDWAKKMTDKYHITHQQIGESLAHRPIYSLESRTDQSNKWLVILGRMHPPEITGALALFPFVDTLLADSQLANEFRQEYNILIVPNINPDGVAAGNWRHNLNGVDLNRDWKTFRQPEVKVVHQYLKQLQQQGNKMSMAVDFHSTRRDIFYTMPNDYGVEQPYLVNNWLGSLDQMYPNFKVIQKPGNNPGKGVFKQYFSDQYGVHAITYEMGDNTDRKFITKLAGDAAKTLMQTMLESNEERRYE